MDSEPRRNRSDYLKTWPPILLGAGGLLVGVVTFFFQNIYLPTHQPRSVTISSKLERAGESGRFTVLKGSFRLRNISKTRVDLLGVYYNVRGSRMEQTGLNDGEFSEFVAQNLREAGSVRFMRHASESGDSVVLSGRLLDDTAWLDAEQEYDHEFHVYVPRGRYDLLQLQVVVAYAKDTRATALQWGADAKGAIVATACRKLEGYAQNNTKCEALDAKSAQYAESERKYGLAGNDSMSELSLLPAGSDKPPESKR